MWGDADEKGFHNIRRGKIIPEEYACKGPGGVPRKGDCPQGTRVNLGEQQRMTRECL